MSAKPIGEPLRTTALFPYAWVVWVFSVGVIAAAGLYLAANWDRVPASFPVHYNLRGTPDRWTAKTSRSVSAVLVIGGLMQLLLSLVGFGMNNSSRRGPEGSPRLQMLRANLLLVLITQAMTACLFAYISLLPLLGKPPALIFIVFTLLLLSTIAGFLMYMVRLNNLPDDSEAPTPDSSWHFGGLIYYNPADPSLMVEKRFGLGYTINMAHRLSWVFLAVALLVTIAPAILFRK